MSLQLRTIIDAREVFIDLFGDEPVLLNFSTAEIQDITAKNSAFSQEFSIPGTKNNNDIFNFYYDLNSIPQTFNPNNKFASTLLWDGIIILEGYIRLNGVTITDGDIIYSVTFYNQIGDLSANIGDKFLYDLDLADLSHPWSTRVVLESNTDYNLFPLTGTTNYSYQNGKTFWGLYNIGYQYISGSTINASVSPLLQFSPVFSSSTSPNTYYPTYGNFDFKSTPLHDYYYKPSIQIKELYQRICNQAGFQVKSDFFDTAYFDRFYLPLKFSDETIYPKNAIIACYSYDGQEFGLDGTPQYTNPSSGVTCNSLGLVATTSSLTFPPIYAGQYTFQFGFYYASNTSCDVAETSPELNLWFSDGTNTVNLFQTSTCDTFQSQSTSFQRDFIFTGNSVIQFYFTGNYMDVGGFNFQIKNGPRFLVSGQTIDYRIEFPQNDYKQIDFITSVNRYFNLIVVPSPDNPKTLIVEPIVDYIGKGPVLDWTTKISGKEPQSLKPTNSLINGTLDFEFHTDNDYTNEEFKTLSNRIFGTQKIQLNQEFKDNVTTFNSLFSSPIDLVVSNVTNADITLSSMSKLKSIDVSGKTIQTFIPYKINPKLVFRGLTMPNANYGNIGEFTTFTSQTNCTSGVTLNVTKTGYIKYNDCAGNQIYWRLNSLGSDTYNQCIDPTSIQPGYPLSDIANYTITSTGTTCQQAVTINKYQTYWMNDVEMATFTNTNRFTTYPFNFNNFSHYTNWRGTDFSNISNPEEFMFVNENLYDLYYKDYVEDLISLENKLYSAKIYLTPYEVKALKFNEKILINNTYFRINKISNYNLLEPAICDIELVKLTKTYKEHRKLYYRLTPCSGDTVLYSNSDIMYNLYGYVGSYTTIFDDDLNYLGCYSVSIDAFNETADYQHYYLSSGFTPNLTNVFSDCTCSAQTFMNIVQDKPADQRVYAYEAEICEYPGESFTVYSYDPNLLPSPAVYKQYFDFDPTFFVYCLTNFRRSAAPAYDYFQRYELFENCEDCYGSGFNKLYGGKVISDNGCECPMSGFNGTITFNNSGLTKVETSCMEYDYSGATTYFQTGTTYTFSGSATVSSPFVFNINPYFSGYVDNYIGTFSYSGYNETLNKQYWTGTTSGFTGTTYVGSVADSFSSVPISINDNYYEFDIFNSYYVNNTECIPVSPTMTPSNTPTPSITPSNTPTPAPVTCRIYSNETPSTWFGDYIDCDGITNYNVTLLGGEQICAQSYSTIYGPSLTIGVSCIP
jgi:hypothetical protein